MPASAASTPAWWLGAATLWAPGLHLGKGRAACLRVTVMKSGLAGPALSAGSSKCPLNGRRLPANDSKHPFCAFPAVGYLQLLFLASPQKRERVIFIRKFLSAQKQKRKEKKICFIFVLFCFLLSRWGLVLGQMIILFFASSRRKAAQERSQWATVYFISPHHVAPVAALPVPFFPSSGGTRRIIFHIPLPPLVTYFITIRHQNLERYSSRRTYLLRVFTQCLTPNGV